MEKKLEEIKKEFTAFLDDAAQCVAKGNKAAGARSRKTSSKIALLLKDWRKISIPGYTVE